MKVENEKFDIILLAGQSNADGSGIGEDEFEFVQDDDVMIMRGDFEASVKKSEYGNEYLDLKLSDEYKVMRADYLLNDEGQKKGCFAFCSAFSLCPLYSEGCCTLYSQRPGDRGCGKGYRGGYLDDHDPNHRR